MKDPILTAPRWLLGVVIFLSAATAFPATLSGRVVGVHDGDTITVLDANHQQHKIRFAGIDAPESRQAFGTRSRQNLSGLVFGKDVAVEWNKHDRYKRIVGKVLVDGHDVNLEQVRAGMAWWYRQYAKDQTSADR
jgi:endonuclease YncB( thermonuclease family)